MLIGPRTNIKKDLIGGATISFDLLIDELKQHVHCDVINTQKYQGVFAQIVNILRVIGSMLWFLPKTQIIFLNSSKGGATYLLPIAFYLARIFGKKIVFRPFGGNFDTHLSQLPVHHRKRIEKILSRVDLLFLQTHDLMKKMSALNRNINHLPTSRPDPIQSTFKVKKLSDPIHLVFLGSVDSTKGVDLLLSMMTRQTNRMTLKIYGPIQDEKYQNNLPDFKDVYAGPFQPKDLYNIFSEADFLILPTQYSGEGYPGVIIEAYAHGVPVIVTPWRSIPEIVTHEKTGMIMADYSVEAIYQCLDAINQDLYTEMSWNARQMFLDQFESGQISKQIISNLEAVLKDESH